MKLKFLLITSTLIFLLSSFKSEKLLSISSSHQDSLVVIFEKAPLTKKKQTGNFYTADHFDYFDNSGILIEHKLDNFGVNDTVRIPVQGDLKGVELVYNYIRFNYLLHSGDTLLFTFPDDIPEAISLHKKIPDSEVNVDKLVKIELSETLKNNNLLSTPPKEPFSMEKELLKGINKHQVKLEGLKKMELEGRLSSPNYLFLADVESARFYSHVNSGLFKEIVFSHVEKDSILHFSNRKDLLSQPFFHRFLMGGFLKGNIMNVRRIRHAQGISLDYKEAYAKVKAQVRDPEIRNWLLYYCVDRLGTEGTKDEFGQYLKLLQEDTGDVVYVNHLLNSYGAEIQVDPGGKTQITNYYLDKNFEFSELLAASKGQLVYVDIWASWCMPCRAAMPASKALHNEFKGKGVRFVYLSLDQKVGDWKKAIAEEKLESYVDSFLILNPRNAELVKSMAIRTIPRYLLYGKNGELLHQNAPGPDSPELRELLLKYLD